MTQNTTPQPSQYGSKDMQALILEKLAGAPPTYSEADCLKSEARWAEKIDAQPNSCVATTHYGERECK